MINIASNTVFLNNGETDYLVTIGVLNANSISSTPTVIISSSYGNLITNNTISNTFNFSLGLSQLNANDIVSNTYLQNFIREYVRNDKLIEDITDLDNGTF